MKTRLVFLAASLLGSWIAAAAEPGEPQFRGITVDDRIQIGYGVAVADVDGDKQPDILLADKKQFAWYRNPGPEKIDQPWQRYVLAENLTPRDNVCIAAQDIDGDGKCEVAVGAEWNPGDTQNSGAVFYLIPPADRTERWEPVKLHAEPTVHRMRWWKDGGKWKLLVLPLHGRGNRNGEGDPVKMLMYDPPADPRAEWKTSVVDESLHQTHNLTVGPNGTIFVAGKEGVATLTRSPSGWDRSWVVHGPPEGYTYARSPSLWENHEFRGAGEVRVLASGAPVPWIATVEPMHGNVAAVYISASDDFGLSRRVVLARDLTEGHALGCADFLGLGRDQVVVGWRGNPGQPRPVGIKLFTPLDEAGLQWRESVVDENGMATEDLQIADVNGDGRPDIVAAGRATKNLKLYLNQTGAAQ